jgi:hypothetical protein
VDFAAISLGQHQGLLDGGGVICVQYEPARFGNERAIAKKKRRSDIRHLFYANDEFHCVGTVDFSACCPG